MYDTLTSIIVKHNLESLEEMVYFINSLNEYKVSSEIIIKNSQEKISNYTEALYRPLDFNMTGYWGGFDTKDYFDKWEEDRIISTSIRDSNFSEQIYIDSNFIEFVFYQEFNTMLSSDYWKEILLELISNMYKTGKVENRFVVIPRGDKVIDYSTFIYETIESSSKSSIDEFIEYYKKHGGKEFNLFEYHETGFFKMRDDSPYFVIRV